MSLPAPSFSAATLAVFRLHRARLLRGRRIWLGLFAVALVCATMIITRYLADVDPKTVFMEGVSYGFFWLLVYLAPFLLCSGAIAEEVEGRTLAFLTARPIARSALALGKYLAGVAFAVGLLAGGILLLHLALYIGEPTLLIEEVPGTLRIMGAVALLGALYGATCAFWGAVVPSAGGTIAFIYLATVEFGLAILPDYIRFSSMNYWGRELAGLDRTWLMPESVPEVATAVAFAPILGELALFVALTMVVVSVSELRFGKA